MKACIPPWRAVGWYPVTAPLGARVKELALQGKVRQEPELGDRSSEPPALWFKAALVPLSGLLFSSCPAVQPIYLHIFIASWLRTGLVGLPLALGGLY